MSTALFNLLLLGGTSEAQILAQTLVQFPQLRLINSLAGRTMQPRLPPGEIRMGGFGGVAGLINYLRQERVHAVIDATHPFAAQMGTHAAMGCAEIGIPLLRLERPPWTAQSGDCWHEVAHWDAAVTHLQQGAQRVLLAVGRQELTPFTVLTDLWFLIRSVDLPNPLPAFAHAEFLLSRGPFNLVGETTLLREYAIDTLVCKNSGGAATAPKLTAARNLGVKVIMRQRPPRPHVTQVIDVMAAVHWLQQLRGLT